MSRILARSLLVGLLGLCVGASFAMAQTSVNLGGGGTSVDLPPDNQPGFAIKNGTGIPICDFVITVTAGAFDVTGAHVSDPAHGGEDWDVDDDQMGGLSTGAGGESTAAPGAEGAGPAALGHPDNTQPAGSRTLRAEEVGYNHCIRPGRTASLTLTFSAQPNNGDKIEIQPTNERGRNIYSFKDGLLALAEVWKLLDSYVSTGFAAWGTATGTVTQMILTIDEAVPLWVETDPPSHVEYTHLDGFGGQVVLTFDPPVPGEKGILIEGDLSEFGSIHVEGIGIDGEPVDDKEPVDDNRPVERINR